MVVYMQGDTPLFHEPRCDGPIAPWLRCNKENKEALASFNSTKDKALQKGKYIVVFMGQCTQQDAEVLSYLAEDYYLLIPLYGSHRSNGHYHFG